MTRFLLLLALAALGGCATTSSDYYRDGRYYGDSGYYDDGRYDDGGYADDGYYRDRYYDGGYAGGDYYYGDYYGGGYAGYGYASDYLMWPAYYSIFWPISHWYVDPYYYPGYYYGVTYFPRDYWSLSLTWGNSYRSGWGYSYGGYMAYSPYRYSWADNYYDWYPWYSQHSHYHARHNDLPCYGSARNEAERDRDYDVLSEAEIGQNEFYDWMERTNGVRYFVGARVADLGPRTLFASIEFDRRRGPADDDRVALFRRLAQGLHADSPARTGQCRSHDVAITAVVARPGEHADPVGQRVALEDLPSRRFTRPAHQFKAGNAELLNRSAVDRPGLGHAVQQSLRCAHPRSIVGGLWDRIRILPAPTGNRSWRPCGSTPGSWDSARWG